MNDVTRLLLTLAELETYEEETSRTVLPNVRGRILELFSDVSFKQLESFEGAFEFPDKSKPLTLINLAEKIGAGLHQDEYASVKIAYFDSDDCRYLCFAMKRLDTETPSWRNDIGKEVIINMDAPPSFVSVRDIYQYNQVFWENSEDE